MFPPGSSRRRGLPSTTVDGNRGSLSRQQEIKRLMFRRKSTATSSPQETTMSNPTPITLSITVISATELAAADSNGLSDPYVSLTIQDSSGTTGGSHLSKKTNVMKKTLNPVWNENFVFR